MKKMILASAIIALLLTGCRQNESVLTPDPIVISQIDELITGYSDEGVFSGSVLIAEKGFVLLNNGYGFADYESQIPNTPQTQFSIGSVTKLFTCAALRMEADRGALTQDDTLAKYISDYPRGDEITISQLLNHTSGITDLFNDIWYAKPFDTQDPIKIEALIDRFKYEPLEFDPGTEHDYSNSGFILLAHIIEQVSELTYNEFIEQEIFVPLEMNDSVADWDTGFSKKALGYFNPYGNNPPSIHPGVHQTHIVGTGNLFSTVEDLYLWYQALHRDESWRPYGCGAHFGRGFGYTAAFIPIHGLDIVVIMLSNFIGAPLEQMVLDIEDILVEDDLVELEVELLDSFAGEYQALWPDGRDTTILITRVGDHLTVNDTGSNILGFFSLYPISPERFIMKTGIGYSGYVDFRKVDSGDVTQMILDDSDLIELTLIE